MKNNTILPFVLLIFIFIFVIAFTPIRSQSSVTEIIPICFNPLICSNENCVNSITYQYQAILTFGNRLLITNPVSQTYNTQEITFTDSKIKNVLKYPTYNTSSFLFPNKQMSNVNLNTTFFRNNS